jgi:hypothetical protein
MTEGRTIVDEASINNLYELEKGAREAAHAKFAQWHKEEREQRPHRILLFSLAAVVIIVVMALLILTYSGP